ncbi:MAG TPA: GNAT family N-acetyltransferase [Candidatus Cloacimonadota bacterium]|nr:GNAT family N-acetyltransferase [Candidatus Cloacimonadota bacterium]
MQVKRFSSASMLPEAWDSLASSYFQQREFLLHTETHNPCKQRYYLAYEEDILRAGIVVYSLRLDLFTYAFLKIPLQMNIAGIPCSVSASGMLGPEALLPQLLELLKPHEKGFLVWLNLDSQAHIPGVMSGKTLPTLLFQNRFQSWEDYQNCLRSDYKRRLHLTLKAFQGLTLRTSDCSGFDDEMYRLYLEVLARSKGKLESLSLSFFRALPPAFQLSAYYDGKILVGWYITLAQGDRLFFFLGGYEQSLNHSHHSYLNLLYAILRQGIEGGFSQLDFGQTAEIPKQRLGAQLSPKWLLGYHSNPLIRKLLCLARPLLEYSAKFESPHPFKENR